MREDLPIPTPQEMWSLLQQQQEQLSTERARVQQLEERLSRLQDATQPRPKAPEGSAGGRQLSRAALLSAAATGVTGLALLGSQPIAHADTPPPIPSFTAFGAPRRVFGDGSVISSGTTTAAIDATLGGVPAGAGSAYCAVQSNNPGVMTLFPDGSADPGVANWSNTGSPGQLALFYMLVPLSTAGKFRIHTYLNGSIYVDVWGYIY